ncbi:polysaccharide deacetylase family protein [Bacillus alkalicellulosilyticus]|uniref:polysaccharide deacetylase family protein n=1 Tax=Alkalihalobacterium alkalicellulosilyticum TaxID=1912214 RepID=UPI000997B28E|nr:polysaccharide deacetylase family protein [Bacillus alkalicellulosilyticus]
MKQLFGLIVLVVLLMACNGGQQPTNPPEQTAQNGVEIGEEPRSIDEEIAVEVEPPIEEEPVDDVIEEEDTEEVPPQEPLYEVNQSNWRIEPIDDADEAVVLLTIDDVPDKHSLEMAKTLKKHNVNAIYFVNGHFLLTDEGRDQLISLHEDGFEIGNHTMNHPNLSELSAEEQRKEIIEVNEKIEEIIGERPRFFRAPFGVNTDVSREVVEEEGMQYMNWSYGYDYFNEYREADALADIMVNAPELSHGAILLMHDREWTNAALDRIITGLEEKGYSIVDPALIK